MISFVVPGNPVPWERVRSKRGQHFTAPKTRAHQDKIRLYARKARVPRLFGPVRLAVTFYRATKQRCDLDNLAKSVQDALNGIAYADDAQIVALVAFKVLDRERPRTEVEVADAFAPLDAVGGGSWSALEEQCDPPGPETAGKDPTQPA